MDNRIDEWMKVYEEKLRECIIKYPHEYIYPIILVPAVVDRMRLAFYKQSYNKEGRAIKATCKHFGIAYTYAAINNFINCKETDNGKTS